MAQPQMKMLVQQHQELMRYLRVLQQFLELLEEDHGNELLDVDSALVRTIFKRTGALITSMDEGLLRLGKAVLPGHEFVPHKPMSSIRCPGIVKRDELLKLLKLRAQQMDCIKVYLDTLRGARREVQRSNKTLFHMAATFMTSVMDDLRKIYEATRSVSSINVTWGVNDYRS